MKLSLVDGKGTKKGDVQAPAQFNEGYRPDLIKRAVMSLQLSRRQPYGAKPDAGMRASAELSRRRKKYRGSYGFGISRVPRKILTRRGTRMNWVGAVAPGTVGGRRAHPPKATKVLVKGINVKERRKAIRSALGATLDVALVKERGHVAPEAYPFVLSADVEKTKTTKELLALLTKLGFQDELKRTKEKTIRAGKGTMRGRKYKKKTGVLLVVSQACELMNVDNIPGVDIIPVETVNAEYLAPGAQAGRMTLFTDQALKIMEEKHLFQ